MSQPNEIRLFQGNPGETVSRNHRPPERVVVVLATYNGERFIEEQLASIQSQTHSDWRLIVRDDGSADRTRTLLERAARFDNRLQIIADDNIRLGPGGNFSRLLEIAQSQDADYVLFADQDDVWFYDKIEKQMDVMRRMESEHLEGTPLLVHSDASITNGQLKVTHDSLANYAKLAHPEQCHLQTVLFQGRVLGCSVLMNRALLGLMVPVPAGLLHDHWAALCASAAGQVEYIAEPTLFYRRHGDNNSQAGAPRVSSWRFVFKLVRNAPVETQKSHYRTRVLWQRLSDSTHTPSCETENVLRSYCELFESPMSSLRRIWRLRRLGMPRLNPWRRALWYFRFLFAKHSDQHHQYSQSVLAQSESSGSPHKSLLNKTA